MTSARGGGATFGRVSSASASLQLRHLDPGVSVGPPIESSWAGNDGMPSRTMRMSADLGSGG